MGRFIVDDGSAGLSQSKLGMTVFGGLSTQGGLSATCADGEYVYFDGNVGIGTPTPTQPLHIVSSTDQRGFKVVGVNSQTIELLPQAAQSAPYFGTTSNHDMRFGANNGEKMRITTGGNVGIGTTAPSEVLTLNATSNARLLLQEGGADKGAIAAGGSGLFIQNKAGDIHFRNIADAETVTIKDSGNVGIGIIAPTRLLTLSGGGDSYEAGLMIKNGAGYEGDIYMGTGGGHTSTNMMNFRIGNTGAGQGLWMWSDSTATARMILNPTGLGIGTITPLQILHLHASDTALRIADSSSSRSWDLHASSANKFHITDATRNIARITIMGSASGQVGIGTMWPSRTLDIGGGSDGMVLPVGTTAERPTTYLSGGTMRFNSSLNAFEGYTGSAWGSLGGGNAFDGASVIRYNDQTLSENVTVGTPGSLSANGFTAGPITIEDGYTVTIEHGSNWTII